MGKKKSGKWKDGLGDPDLRSTEKVNVNPVKVTPVNVKTEAASVIGVDGMPHLRPQQMDDEDIQVFEVVHPTPIPAPKLTPIPIPVISTRRLRNYCETCVGGKKKDYREKIRKIRTAIHRQRQASGPPPRPRVEKDGRPASVAKGPPPSKRKRFIQTFSATKAHSRIEGMNKKVKVRVTSTSAPGDKEIAIVAVVRSIPTPQTRTRVEKAGVKGTSKKTIQGEQQGQRRSRTRPLTLSNVPDRSGVTDIDVGVPGRIRTRGVCPSCILRNKRANKNKAAVEDDEDQKKRMKEAKRRRRERRLAKRTMEYQQRLLEVASVIVEPEDQGNDGNNSNSILTPDPNDPVAVEIMEMEEVRPPVDGINSILTPDPNGVVAVEIMEMEEVRPPINGNNSILTPDPNDPVAVEIMEMEEVRPPVDGNNGNVTPDPNGVVAVEIMEMEEVRPIDGVETNYPQFYTIRYDWTFPPEAEVEVEVLPGMGSAEGVNYSYTDPVEKVMTGQGQGGGQDVQEQEDGSPRNERNGVVEKTVKGMDLGSRGSPRPPGDMGNGGVINDQRIMSPPPGKVASGIRPGINASLNEVVFVDKRSMSPPQGPVASVFGLEGPIKEVIFYDRRSISSPQGQARSGIDRGQAGLATVATPTVEPVAHFSGSPPGGSGSGTQKMPKEDANTLQKRKRFKKKRPVVQDDGSTSSGTSASTAVSKRPSPRTRVRNIAPEHDPDNNRFYSHDELFIAKYPKYSRTQSKEGSDSSGSSRKKASPSPPTTMKLWVCPDRLRDRVSDDQFKVPRAPKQRRMAIDSMEDLGQGEGTTSNGIGTVAPPPPLPIKSGDVVPVPVPNSRIEEHVQKREEVEKKPNSEEKEQKENVGDIAPPPPSPPPPPGPVNQQIANSLAEMRFQLVNGPNVVEVDENENEEEAVPDPEPPQLIFPSPITIEYELIDLTGEPEEGADCDCGSRRFADWDEFTDYGEEEVE